MSRQSVDVINMIQYINVYHSLIQFCFMRFPQRLALRNYHSNSHPLSWFVITLIGLNQSQLVKDKAEKLPR
jgi:hypothetical protein